MRMCLAVQPLICCSKSSKNKVAITGSILHPAHSPLQPHRPAYGPDGDYWSKPNVENIFDVVYEIMHEGNARYLPTIYK